MHKTQTKVMFIWHMHQPCYKHPDKNYYILPWVRLHAVKDYFGMAKTVDKFDKVKVTFNFSGILLQQLLDYAVNGAQDFWGILSLKNPKNLKKDEKEFIVKHFFSINFDKFIRPNKRYLQLHTKKASHNVHFTCEDIGDLQALYNLCWFHPYTIKADKHLHDLIKKEKGYTCSDRQYIMKKQYEIIAQIIPLYKKLIAQKRIEISLTPHYHPIMPLIYDTDILHNFPYLKKPPLRFSRPIDCVWHLSRARQAALDIFGYAPVGSWPSEGSISEDVVSIYGTQRFSWIGADEALLFKSLTSDTVSYDMIKNQRHIIYRPYKFRGVNLFFRDRNLSDILSFTYQGWEDQKFAALDLMEHLKNIHNYTKDILKERAVTIIMDGENAWEYYPNNGITFLEAVYHNLENNECLTTTTPSQFLGTSEGKNLERLACGSWINGDFGVWVGNKKNNFYWHILRKIKDLIEKATLDNKTHEKVMEYFYLLEGSDWFWWNTFEDTSGEFKRIFFTYVDKMYTLLGKEPPSYIS